MRDPNMPADFRLHVAETAAPFIHAKPGRVEAGKRSARRKNGARGTAAHANSNPGKEARGNGAANAGAASQAGNEPDLLPLNYMLEVMCDPEAPQHLRVRAAFATVPFVHPKKKQARPPKVEPGSRAVFEGFNIDPEVAEALHWDRIRRSELNHRLKAEPKPGEHAKPEDRLSPAEQAELAELNARIDATIKAIGCPPHYDVSEYRQDSFRLRVLQDKTTLRIQRCTSFPSGKPVFKMSDAESEQDLVETAEVYQLDARQAGFAATAKGQALKRWQSLLEQAADRGNVTEAEKSEYQQLEARYPELRVG